MLLTGLFLETEESTLQMFQGNVDYIKLDIGLMGKNKINDQYSILENID